MKEAEWYTWTYTHVIENSRKAISLSTNVTKQFDRQTNDRQAALQLLLFYFLYKKNQACGEEFYGHDNLSDDLKNGEDQRKQNDNKFVTKKVALQRQI